MIPFLSSAHATPPGFAPAQVLKALAADDRRPYDSDIGFASCIWPRKFEKYRIASYRKGE